MLCFPIAHVPSVIHWLKRYPTITIVARDRSKEFSAAITAALPHAQHVADRAEHTVQCGHRTQLAVQEHRIGTQPHRGFGPRAGPAWFAARSAPAPQASCRRAWM